MIVASSCNYTSLSLSLSLSLYIYIYIVHVCGCQKESVMLTHQSMKLKDEDMKVVVLDNLRLINALLEHLHQQSTNYSILASQNLLYHLYHIILQHSQHLNFYFPILLIKIIFLHNKIIYPKIIITYNTTHYLLFLSHSFCSTTTATFIETTITTSPSSLHYTHLTPPPTTYNLPLTPKKKKRKTQTINTTLSDYQHHKKKKEQPIVPTTCGGKPRPKPMASPNPHP